MIMLIIRTVNNNTTSMQRIYKIRKKYPFHYITAGNYTSQHDNLMVFHPVYSCKGNLKLKQSSCANRSNLKLTHENCALCWYTKKYREKFTCSKNSSMNLLPSAFIVIGTFSPASSSSSLWAWFRCNKLIKCLEIISDYR